MGKMGKNRKKITPERELELLRAGLGYQTSKKRETRDWLSITPRINAVMGSEEKGIPYGKIIEISGWESVCKTLLAYLILAAGQEDGAITAYVDLESSYDPEWAVKCGIDINRLYVFCPQLIETGRRGKTELQTAEQLLEETEAWIRKKHRENPKGKMILALDSITGLLVAREAEGGIADQNMNTMTALSRFLSQLLRRWAGTLAPSYNVMIVLVNQKRMKPGVMYGSPEDTTGGKALKFYSHVRTSLARVKGGRLLQSGKLVGIRGIAKNIKNKAGGGSVEGAECGFKVLFKGNRWKFLSAKKVRKDDEEEQED
jgi:recombination protein RecA